MASRLDPDERGIWNVDNPPVQWAAGNADRQRAQQAFLFQLTEQLDRLGILTGRQCGLAANSEDRDRFE